MIIKIYYIDTANVHYAYNKSVWVYSVYARAHSVLAACDYRYRDSGIVTVVIISLYQLHVRDIRE